MSHLTIIWHSINYRSIDVRVLIHFYKCTYVIMLLRFKVILIRFDISTKVSLNANQSITTIIFLLT